MFDLSEQLVEQRVARRVLAEPRLAALGTEHLVEERERESKKEAEMG